MWTRPCITLPEWLKREKILCSLPDGWWYLLPKTWPPYRHCCCRCGVSGVSDSRVSGMSGEFSRRNCLSGSSQKDRSAYDAYMRALDDVKKLGTLPIPMNLRNAPTKLMKKLGYGKGYDEYTKEDLLPDKLKGKKYYLK